MVLSGTQLKLRIPLFGKRVEALLHRVPLLYSLLCCNLTAGESRSSSRCFKDQNSLTKQVEICPICVGLKSFIDEFRWDQITSFRNSLLRQSCPFPPSEAYPLVVKINKTSCICAKWGTWCFDHFESLLITLRDQIKS